MQLARTSKNSNDSLIASSCFSSDISARVSWSSLANVISEWKMEVYNICTLSYVGSHRDGYFWAVFGHFAHLVARDCYKQKEFSDIPYG